MKSFKADQDRPDPRNKTEKDYEMCVKTYFDPLFIEKQWFIFHVNAEFDFQSSTWNYPTKKVRSSTLYSMLHTI